MNLAFKKYIRIFFLLVFIYGCSIKKQNEYEIKINVEYGLSYSLDLDKKTYKINYSEEKPVIISFKLSEEEEKKIKHSYFDLGLKDLSPLEDKCYQMPKIITKISIRSNNGIKNISIDEHCNEYESEEVRINANKIKSFLKIIHNIVITKIDKRNIRSSDVKYY
jgi:hypothetical protein